MYIYISSGLKNGTFRRHSLCFLSFSKKYCLPCVSKTAISSGSDSDKPHVPIDNYTSLSLSLLRSELWLSFIPVGNRVSCLQQNTFRGKTSGIRLLVLESAAVTHTLGILTVTSNRSGHLNIKQKMKNIERDRKANIRKMLFFFARVNTSTCFLHFCVTPKCNSSSRFTTVPYLY